MEAAGVYMLVVAASRRVLRASSQDEVEMGTSGQSAEIVLKAQ